MTRNRLVHRLALIIGLLACFVLVSPEANSGACWQPLPVEHIERTDVVFFGEIERTRETLREDVSKTVTFRVFKAYKGVQSETIEIAPHPFGDTRLDIPYYQPMLVFARLVDDAEHGKIVATATNCSMRPYTDRQELHPQYWELLVTMSKENTAERADGEK